MPDGFNGTTTKHVKRIKRRLMDLKLATWNVRRRSKWMDEIGKDLWKMGKRNWKMIVPDREKWRDLVKEAKGHLGL